MVPEIQAEYRLKKIKNTPQKLYWAQFFQCSKASYVDSGFLFLFMNTDKHLFYKLTWIVFMSPSKQYASWNHSIILTHWPHTLESHSTKHFHDAGLLPFLHSEHLCWVVNISSLVPFQVVYLTSHCWSRFTGSIFLFY